MDGRMKKNRRNTTVMVVLFCFLGLFMIFHYVREMRDERALEHSRDTTAIITKIKVGGGKSPASGHFSYRVGSKEYVFSESGRFQFAKIGDTVLIKYAIEDHSVARVKDKYYMKKYHSLKKRQ